jgi:hypothetical protein
MKAVPEEEKCKTLFVGNNKVNATNISTDQRYIDEKLQCIIFCAISSSLFKNSYFNDINFAYSNN